MEIAYGSYIVRTGSLIDINRAKIISLIAWDEQRGEPLPLAPGQTWHICIRRAPVTLGTLVFESDISVTQYTLRRHPITGVGCLMFEVSGATNVASVVIEKVGGTSSPSGTRPPYNPR